MTKLSKKFLSIILIIFVTLFATNVYASCTADDIARLKREALNVNSSILPHVEICYPEDDCYKEELKYTEQELRKNTEGEFNQEALHDAFPYGTTSSGEEGYLPFVDKMYLEINIYNMSENLRATIDYSRQTSSIYPKTISYEDDNANLHKNDINSNCYNVKNYNNKCSFDWYGNSEIGYFTIKIYGSEKSGCNGERLREIKITHPKVNAYYQFSLCDGLEDYFLCKPFVSTDLSNLTAADFLNQVNEEKSNRVEKEKNDKEKEKKGELNYVHLFSITAAGVGLIVVGFVILKKKRR